MTNPFEEIERAAEADRLRQLEQALRLDRAEEVDVTDWEADFLDSVIRQLRDDRRSLTQRQIETLNRICDKYDVC